MWPSDCSEDEKEFNEPNLTFDSVLLELLLLTIVLVSDAPTSTVQPIVVATFSCAAPQSDRSIAQTSGDNQAASARLVASTTVHEAVEDSSPFETMVSEGASAAPAAAEEPALSPPPPCKETTSPAPLPPPPAAAAAAAGPRATCASFAFWRASRAFSRARAASRFALALAEARSSRRAALRRRRSCATRDARLMNFCAASLAWSSFSRRARADGFVVGDLRPEDV